MIYVVIVLIVLLLLAIVVIFAMASGIEHQKTRASEARLQLDSARREMAVIAAAHEQESNTKEEVIANLKKEIGELEKDLASNRDPAVVRSRLAKLLSNP